MTNNVKQTDEYWLSEAYRLAERAASENEVPVGALIVYEGACVGEGWNRPIGDCDPTAHAEIMAMRQAAQAIGNYRLLDCELYVTLEPCSMCVGAMIHARIKRLVFGAYDLRAGALQSVFQIADEPRLNHRLQWQGGVMADQCGALLKDFFRARR